MELNSILAYSTARNKSFYRVAGDHGDVGLHFENVEDPDKTVKPTVEKLGTDRKPALPVSFQAHWKPTSTR